jgi:hypothetical protein
MTSVERRPSLVLTFTRDVTFVQPGYPISSTPKTLSRQKISEKNYTLSLELCCVPLVGFCAYRIRTEIREIMRGCFVSHMYTHLTNNHSHPVKTLHKYHVVWTTFVDSCCTEWDGNTTKGRVVVNVSQTDSRTDAVSTLGVLPLFTNEGLTKCS